jgi:hypothetical protein
MADAMFERLGHPLDLTPNAGANTFAIDASNKSLEHPFLSETNQPITRLFIPPATLTGAQPLLRVSLQGLDGSGNPDGVTKSSGNATATFTPTAAAQWVNLGSSYTPVRGEALCLVISYVSGTIGASNNALFVRSYGGVSNPHVYYSIGNTGGSRSRFGGSPTITAYGTATRAFGVPLSNATTVTYSSSLEFASRFTVPVGWGQSFQILGVIAFLNAPNGSTLTCSVYRGGAVTDTTAATSATSDGDWTTTGAERNFPFVLPTPVTINYGETFRVGVSVNTGSSTVRVIETLNAADMDAFPLGQGMTYSQRSGGNWTDTSTRRCCMQLVLSDISPGLGRSVFSSPIIRRGF